jgi:hypothetical protein
VNHQFGRPYNPIPAVDDKHPVVNSNDPMFQDDAPIFNQDAPPERSKWKGGSCAPCDHLDSTGDSISTFAAGTAMRGFNRMTEQGLYIGEQARVSNHMGRE